MIGTTECEVAAHGAVLQIDIGLVMTILGSNPVQALDLGVDAFVLLEQIVLLKPAGVLEQLIGLGGWCRDLLVHAGKGQIGFDLGQRVHGSVLGRASRGAAAITGGQQQACQQQESTHQSRSVRAASP
ncbi:hypothetical protein D3C78_1365880 [compost metagenome]